MKPDLSVLINMLQESPLFAEVPKEQIHWLVDHCEYSCLQEGDCLFQQDQPLTSMVILLKGKIAIRQKQNGNFKLIKEVNAGEITGVLPFSRAEKALASSEAIEPTEILQLSQKHFKEMIRDHYELVEVLVHHMTSRVRHFTESRQQSEKMEALGKLSAGLTHELNNPASAVLRSSSALGKSLQSFPKSLQEIILKQPDPEALNKAYKLVLRKAESASASKKSLLEQTSLEDEHAERLEKLGMKNALEIAETFAEFDLNIEEIQALEEHFREKDQLRAVIRWLSQIMSMIRLTEEIQESSRSISELVKAVKSYSHMDRSPEKEPTDIREGIDHTLTLLNFKLRKKNIQVHTTFEDDLPKPCVYAGEINQLWTNLIDNAIDALDKNGEIHIKANSVREHEEAYIKIDVCDNGSGIPEDMQQKIFDPFFTTKGSGEGSGLGLDIVKRIIDNHNGKISLSSEPGNTKFTILLPL